MQGRRAASPLFYVKAGAPPFIVTYCQWDYFSLPGQAREFYQELRQAGVDAELLYVPRERPHSHRRAEVHEADFRELIGSSSSQALTK
jgi:dipeptidyl aminopeptidase/acylaminoacyl peptidase